MWILALAVGCWDRIFRPSNFSSTFAINSCDYCFMAANTAASSPTSLRRNRIPSCSPPTMKFKQRLFPLARTSRKCRAMFIPRCARISSLAWKLLHTHHHDLPPLGVVPTQPSCAVCSTTTVAMATNPAASFADILAAVSDHVMPTNDKDAQAALASFGAVSKNNCTDANVVVFSPVWRRSTRTTTTSHGWSRR